jgi:hypothetical protein
MILDYEKGSIIRIKDYVFEDGTKRDKYLIVLDKDNQTALIIHSLTTSKLKFTPNKLFFGCNIYQKNEYFSIPYFYFPKEQILDIESGFFFDIDTYIFFQNNTTKVEISMIEQYNTQPFGLICLGKLSDYDMKRLIKCILKSDLVPNNIKETLKMQD